jgi:glycosyltransferase involved in cell wall biosynthesis
MACGTPTIAANRTSLPEVVGDGGLLVEPDAEAFAAAMHHVLTDGNLSAALRSRGLARAATFTWQQTARLTLAAYQEVVADDTTRNVGAHSRAPTR